MAAKAAIDIVIRNTFMTTRSTRGSSRNVRVGNAADVTPLMKTWSSLEAAPRLREVYLKYPIEQLEHGFAEGMGSKDREMPQVV